MLSYLIDQCCNNILIQKRATILRMAKQREALQREHIKESMLVKEQELIFKQT